MRGAWILAAAAVGLVAGGGARADGGGSMRHVALGVRQVVELPGGLRVRLADVVVEEIAPSPDDPGAYPAGSGVDVHLEVARGAKREALVLNELSPPYESRREAAVEGYRLRLGEVRGLYREVRVELEVALPAGAAGGAAEEAGERFLAELEPGVPFEIRVGGQAQEAFVTRKACAYTEWTTGELEAGELASFRLPLRSERPLRFTSGKLLVEVPLGWIRFHLRPAHQRTYRAGDEDAPEVVRQRLAEEGSSTLTLVEYCLEPGARAWAVVKLEPGAPAGQAPAPRRVLLVSDRPIPAAGKPPPGPPTPACRERVD